MLAAAGALFFAAVFLTAVAILLAAALILSAAAATLTRTASMPLGAGSAIAAICKEDDDMSVCRRKTACKFGRSKNTRRTWMPWTAAAHMCNPASLRQPTAETDLTTRCLHRCRCHCCCSPRCCCCWCRRCCWWCPRLRDGSTGHEGLGGLSGSPRWQAEKRQPGGMQVPSTTPAQAGQPGTRT